MNKIRNPFEYLSIGKTLTWGLVVTIVSVALVFIARAPFELTASKLF